MAQAESLGDAEWPCSDYMALWLQDRGDAWGIPKGQGLTPNHGLPEGPEFGGILTYFNHPHLEVYYWLCHGLSCFIMLYQSMT